MRNYKAGDRLKTPEGKFVNLIGELKADGWLYFLAIYQGVPDYIAITDEPTLDEQKCHRAGQNYSTCDYRVILQGVESHKDKLIALLTEIRRWDEDAVDNGKYIKQDRIAQLLFHIQVFLSKQELFDDVVYEQLSYETFRKYTDLRDADPAPPEPEEVPQVQLKSPKPQLPIAPLAATITTIEAPKTMSTPTTKSKKSQIVDSMKLGAQTGLADEAGNALLQIADKMTDGKVLHHCPTAETQALLKLVTATLLIHGIDILEADETTKNRVTAACGLVIQAATRDFIQPKMKEIRQATMGLANIGQRSLEAPKTSTEQG